METIEIFKTNVTDPHRAKILIALIDKSFVGHNANFDLDDCDHILRVKSQNAMIQTGAIIELMKDFEFEIEVLSDNQIESSH